MEDLNYVLINRKIDRHGELQKRIANVQKVLRLINSGPYELLPVPGGLGEKGIGSGPTTARLTVPMIQGVEEFDVPIEECEDMLSALLKELKEEFDPLDKKVQRWLKESS